MVIKSGQGVPQEKDISRILISLICLYGEDGVTIDQLAADFESECGYSIPWKIFGAESLRNWLLSLPYIYIVQNRFDQEVVIEQSPRVLHVKDFVIKQRKPHTNANTTLGNKRKGSAGYENENSHPHKILRQQKSEENTYMESKNKFQELESMLPLFYRHQALGDDFFVDIADSKMGYYVPENGPKRTGLCCVGQTISQLTESVRTAKNLAPRVVIMIGFHDLLNDNSISGMICDLRCLVVLLKKRGIKVTLLTLIPSPKMPSSQRFHTKMDIFNRAILDYAYDPVLSCNVLDMNNVFYEESTKFRKDFQRFKKVTKGDPYKVFSDYGRKVFLNSLKVFLREQVKYNY